MDNLYRFGSVEVVCEGYDYPDDPYILKGSCGLEYTLELTKEGQNKNQGIIQFHFFDTIGLTNLSNARYCTPYICYYPKYILQTQVIKGQQYFIVIQIAGRDQAF